MCFGCEKKEDPQISFYYWNTIFNIDKTEQNYLDTLNVNEVYVRFFDIIKENGRIKPNAQIDFGEKTFSPTIIPVVFIEIFPLNTEIESLTKFNFFKLA